MPVCVFWGCDGSSLSFMSQLKGFISWPQRSCNAASPPTVCPPLEVCSSVTPCCMCSVIYLSVDLLVLRQGPSLALEYVLRSRGEGGGAGGGVAVVSTPQHIVLNFWSHQSSYSTCLLLHCQQPQWSVILLLFSVFGRRVLEVSWFRVSNLLIAGTLIFVSVSLLVWFTA